MCGVVRSGSGEEGGRYKVAVQLAGLLGQCLLPSSELPAANEISAEQGSRAVDNQDAIPRRCFSDVTKE